ncbi:MULTISPECIES: LysR family transcriptional regulator [Enterococcus]|uniref:HTH lysR-type domain-containing protein n=1 Tax=Enterococcus sulfureus ATCC 49903 TaxID=1140003 RepID=S0P3D2_9ENTE|nr:LysR family transcriptional regulator [Enterococcus sulfureus]EOT45799.1 hypothetical protein OMY_02032 [Enterococcus sulfureus ATCC 49903]EOT82936.1 hypothetical protein I573_02049 [Enterococcus sulfureus ATCC 49903]
MNIQQMRYVVAIANNGSFREAAKKLYISQPSLSHAIKELENEIGVSLFERTNHGAFLTTTGKDFLQYAQQVLSQVNLLETRFLSPEKRAHHFSIASQHYDFLSHVVSRLIKEFPEYTNFRIYENTTMNIIQEVEHFRSELGILYFNDRNRRALVRIIESGDLCYETLGTFQTHIFLSENHPLSQKKTLTVADLEPYPQVRFTQEENHYTYFSEDILDFFDANQVIHTTDRATLVGILNETQAYGSGSGLVKYPEHQRIVLIPLENEDQNELVLIKKKNHQFSELAQQFLTYLDEYLRDCEK